MVGRKPKPTAIHEMNGFPGHRKPKRHEPTPKRCIPLPPVHLTQAVKDAWKKLALKLDKMRVLTEADSWALEELAETYCEVVELRRRIVQDGRTVKVITTTGDQREVTNPLVHQLGEAAKRFRALMVEFGLTPSSRSRVNVTEEQIDETDRYFQ